MSKAGEQVEVAAGRPAGHALVYAPDTLLFTPAVTLRDDTPRG